MADLTDVRALAGEQTGLAVVATTRAGGSVQASVVNAGVLEHPVGGEQVVGFVTRGGSRKHHHLRERPDCAVTFRRGWEWVTVEGRARLVGPDDPAEGIDADDLRLLLRDVFRAAGGTHDDWETYDRVMAEESRLAVLIPPDRIYGVRTSSVS